MKDFWEWQAEGDLRSYAALKVSLNNLPEQIAELREKLTAIRSPGADSGGHGGSEGADARIVNLLSLIDDREQSLRETKRKVKEIERSLECLNGEEQLVLIKFFIHPEKSAAENLAGILRIDPKTVYIRREQALLKFKKAKYGL